MSATLAFANSAHCSEEKVYVFTCDEKASVHKVEDVPVSAWAAITRLRERHADLVSHNMEVERTGKGEKVETGTGVGKHFMPFHAWLGEQNSGMGSKLPALDTPKFRDDSKEAKAARTVTQIKVE
jgi:hypothetical protein